MPAGVHVKPGKMFRSHRLDDLRLAAELEGIDETAILERALVAELRKVGRKHKVSSLITAGDHPEAGLAIRKPS